MAGEWIPEKARGLIGKIFPGSWEETQTGVHQGRCPGANLHHGESAATDCRIHTGYSQDGKTAPGAFCLHKSCQGVLQALNEEFRNAIFAKDPEWQPSAKHTADAGVVTRPPVNREAWIPEFSIAKLRGLVAGVPSCSPEYFIERSPVDPRKIAPGEFLELAFHPGERIIVFAEFKGPGDYLWEVGKGGFRLAAERGVQAVRSKLPTDGGTDGIWYLCNPVDGQWHGNPRRAGKFSRRSEESITRWRHMVVESDEEKKMKKKAQALKQAIPMLSIEGAMSKVLELLAIVKDPAWTSEMMREPNAQRWLELSHKYLTEAAEIPGLWNRLLAMSPLAIKAIYSSGGDSWHALVNVDMATKADFDAYLRNGAKRVLPKIGADPGAMTPVRLSRLPGCTRLGKLQRLIYLNPNPSPAGVPIRDLPKLRTL